MSGQHTVVAIFESHHAAESAVRDLDKAGFPMDKLSIIGRDYHKDEHVVGYYTTGSRMAVWGKAGAFWGGLWGILMGGAFFWVPGIGPLLIGGPFVAAIVAGLESAAVVGGLSALGAALYSLGISKHHVLRYETAIRADKFLLIAHGTREELDRAKEILDRTGSEESMLHASDESEAATEALNR